MHLFVCSLDLEEGNLEMGETEALDAQGSEEGNSYFVLT